MLHVSECVWIKVITASRVFVVVFLAFGFLVAIISVPVVFIFLAFVAVCTFSLMGVNKLLMAFLCVHINLVRI